MKCPLFPNQKSIEWELFRRKLSTVPAPDLAVFPLLTIGLARPVHRIRDVKHPPLVRTRRGRCTLRGPAKGGTKV